MSPKVATISAVNQRATDALIREIGLVDTIRFLNQFRARSGDYAAEREQLFQDMSVKDIVNAIKARQEGA